MKKRTTDEAINEYEKFSIDAGFTPTINKKNPEETSIARSIANFKKNKKFSNEQLEKLSQIQSKYSTKVQKRNEEEKLSELLEFCSRGGKWPKQNGDHKEKNIYFSCCQRKRYSEKNQKKFDEIKKKYYQSYSYDPTDIYEELLKYVEEKKIFPLRSCEEGHDLAIQIASKKNRNKFTDEQLANIENLRKKYGRKSGVSSQDQLLYFFLNENLCNLEIKAQKKDDSKIDVFIGNSKYKIAIFYDGYYHKFCEERDNLLNEKLIKKGYLVYRLREENLPELINRDNLYIRIIKSKKLDDLIKCEYTGLLSELSEKYLFEIKKCGKSNNELITLAMQNSTSRINTKKVLNEYVSECLFEEVVIPSKSRLSKNIAKQVHDNNLSENELNLYKMVKEIYSKKGKNQ